MPLVGRVGIEVPRTERPNSNDMPVTSPPSAITTGKSTASGVISPLSLMKP
jgi:hypothetical protein